MYYLYMFLYTDNSTSLNSYSLSYLAGTSCISVTNWCFLWQFVHICILSSDTYEMYVSDGNFDYFLILIYLHIDWSCNSFYRYITTHVHRYYMYQTIKCNCICLEVIFIDKLCYYLQNKENLKMLSDTYVSYVSDGILCVLQQH
jgi:hypothetical protein